MDLHDRIVNELLEKKSLAALVYLIQKGRELEFLLDEHANTNSKRYFISYHGAKRFVSLWDGQEEQSFESMEELLEQARLEGEPFLTRWERVKIQTLF